MKSDQVLVFDACLSAVYALHLLFHFCALTCNEMKFRCLLPLKLACANCNKRYYCFSLHEVMHCWCRPASGYHALSHRRANAVSINLNQG